MYEILPYSPELDQRFDHFVKHESVNGTFLQSRRFLNYHPAGRFNDASFALQKSGIIAVYFPGVKTAQNEFISHQGSTFGGPVNSKAFYNGSKLRELLEEADQYLSQFSKTVLKLTPAIFSKESPDLLEYTLEHLGYSRHTELSNYTPLNNGTDPLALCDAKHRKQFFVMGHSEYDADTLEQEYLRDMAQHKSIHVPDHYYPNDDPSKAPLVTWRAHANLLFCNWLNYFVYQTTPYDVEAIEPLR